ncbi:MAG: histidine triad nucleotide-binding protein [Candidatus Dormibacteria bacterium]
MPSCLFCQIVAGDIDADVVRSGELTLAFRDIKPQAPVHVLVIPKEHMASMAELTDDHGDLLVEITRMARWIAASEGIAESGYRLVANTGPDGGQTVDHLHFHLLGGRQMTWPPG